MNKEFNANHFDNIDELLNHCNMWIKDKDYEAYCRWFDMGAMEEIVNHINNYKQALIDIRELVNGWLEIEKHWAGGDHEIDEYNANKILQIIDKSLGDDEKWK